MYTGKKIKLKLTIKNKLEGEKKVKVNVQFQDFLLVNFRIYILLTWHSLATEITFDDIVRVEKVFLYPLSIPSWF